MQRAVGLVRAVHGEWASIEVASGGCGRCHEQGGCGATQLTQVLRGAPARYEVLNSVHAVAGDRVELVLPSQDLRRAVARAYLLPLAALVTGAALGGFWGETHSVVLGLVGLGFGWIGIRFCKKSREVPPQIARVLDGGESCQKKVSHDG